VWQSGFLGVDSLEGGFHGELNSHGANTGAFSTFQAFDTIVDALYNVSFAYRARTNNEAFNVRVFDAPSNFLISSDIKNDKTDEWTAFNGSFIGTGNATTLMFTSITPYSGTVGNFIDAVSVTVPEPGSFILLSLGLLALRASRKANKS